MRIKIGSWEKFGLLGDKSKWDSRGEKGEPEGKEIERLALKLWRNPNEKIWAAEGWTKPIERLENCFELWRAEESCGLN